MRENKKTLASVYSHQNEKDIYQLWEKEGNFKPDLDKEKSPYCIIMPPPNVTGRLHMGHAMYVVQDILIRFYRMLGHPALWLPGTDHAGIATQNVVEKKIGEQGLTRHDLGREKFVEKVWEWKEEYGHTITQQLRKLGASCDWDRERFTLDEHSSLAVRTAFVNLFKQGLIYQGNYMVNWCHRCTSVIADDEVEYSTRQAKIWYLKYPFKNQAGHLTIATTRPETMLGDTAVAVHPEDPRYQKLIGEKLILPLVEREIPVIADQHIDPQFGTGALKVTPAHDLTDYEIGEAHQLEKISVIGFDNKMSKEAGPFAGLEVMEAREAVLEKLKDKGLIEKEEKHTHRVGECYRCHTTIEPLISKQWFVKAKPLAEPALEAVREGKINIIPTRFKKTYYQWLENIRDWCISRQLWWGHQIPVFYCLDCDHIFASVEKPETCPECQSDHLEQDKDVLDTWFSSALWPFSTLGWPDETKDLKTFYPTSVLETGYDIIFFWVARMIMLGLELTGEIPFHDVYLHGLVRDESGQKMSKSLGNVIDPLNIIEKYGADALRYTLISAISPGNDQKFSRAKAEGYRHFANKIWNASRFVLMQIGETKAEELEWKEQDFDNLSLAQKWIIQTLNTTIKKTTQDLKKYRFSNTSQNLYHFFWHELCDWYLEIAKLEIKNQPQLTRKVLFHLLTSSLKLLHPFMPFVTETIWQQLKKQGYSKKNLIRADWPKVIPDIPAQPALDLVKGITETLRLMKTDFNLNPQKKYPVYLRPLDKTSFHPEIKKYLKYLNNLTTLEILSEEKNIPPHSLKSVTSGWEIYLTLDEEFDASQELKHLKENLAHAQTREKSLAKQLENQDFIKNAPPEVVEERKNALDKIQTKIQKLSQQKQTWQDLI